MIPINFLAVIIAAVLMMILGYLWFGPLFGKQWMHLMGITKESMDSGRKQMGKMYAIMFIGALLMSYVLAHALIFASAYTNLAGADAGLMVGLIAWLGFALPITVNYTLTGDKRSWKLWAITSGYYLVSLLLMGVVLAVWA